MAIEVIEGEAKEQGEAERVFAALKHIPGSEYIYNRLPKKFEKQYDGNVYIFDPHETRLMPEADARWFWAHTVISYEPVTGLEIRALVTPEDPAFGVPYTKAFGPEWIDRSMSPKTKVDGLELTPRIVTVKGGGYDQGKQIDKPDRV